MLPTQDRYYFRTEYELELEAWLRQRFRYLCIAYIVFAGFWVLVDLLNLPRWLSQGFASDVLGEIIAHGLSLGVAIWFFRSLRKKHAGRAEVLRAATTMILILGGLSLAGIMLPAFMDAAGTSGMLPRLFYWHLFACLFLPWTPRESLRPIIPLLIVWAIGTLWLRPDNWWMSILGSPVLVMPGIAICAWRLHRHGQTFHTRMLGKHFLTMREEFDRARSIHESMFPSRYEDDHIRFDYTYTPMKELGGDFVHLHSNADGRFVHFTIIDVTGHGLAAALTVNRVFGELERIRAESPEADPAEVITLLNRYFHLTLAKHGIYATAACFTLDLRDSRMRWASAGHPPCYLRGVNRAVTELPATAVLLGALADDRFECESKEMELSPGDVIITCTDGAFEGRNREGEQLGLERLLGLMRLQPPPRNWPQFIASAVQKHTGGTREDDLLIASLHFLSPVPVRTEGEAVMAG